MHSLLVHSWAWMSSNYEMTFYCAIQGSNPEHAEQFKNGVFKVLEDVAAKPVDPALVEAILHQIELHQREINGDGAPIWPKLNSEMV